MSIFAKKNKTSPVAQLMAKDDVVTSAEMALKATIDGILLLDDRGTVKMINPAGLKMTGFDKEEDAIGLNYASVLNLTDEKGNTVQNGNTQFDEAFRQNKLFKTYTYVLTPRQDNQKMIVALTIAPADQNDLHSDRVVVLRDITNVAKLESQQMDFIATASHEMRTPVASIEGYLSLALNPQTATIDERARQYLEEAHQACQRLGGLFKDLLDVAKMTDGSMQLHLVPVEMTATIQQLVNEYSKTEITKKQLQLTFGSASPNQTAQINQVLYSKVDMLLLRGTLDNLIENAVKYTPSGGKIHVNVTGDEHHVIISVADTGIGINQEDLEHIFQRFYRVDSSDTRTVGGTGLGLFLVKKQVEVMNGRVWAESTPGKGSTFYVALPRLSDDEYERMNIAVQNAESLAAYQAQNNNQPQGGNNG